LYDHAHFNETLLNNKSFIFTRSGQSLEVMDRFVKRFDVVTFDDMGDINRLIAENGIDVCYLIEHGGRPDSSYSLPDGCKTVVHCVFKSSDPHGNVYACISGEVNQRSGTRESTRPCHSGKIPERQLCCKWSFCT
jgi:hypothetical protein